MARRVTTSYTSSRCLAESIDGSGSASITKEYSNLICQVGLLERSKTPFTLLFICRLNKQFTTTINSLGIFFLFIPGYIGGAEKNDYRCPAGGHTSIDRSARFSALISSLFTSLYGRDEWTSDLTASIIRTLHAPLDLEEFLINGTLPSMSI